MAVLDEIAARLVGEGIGAIDSKIFLSSRAKLPAGDGPFLTVIETGGTAPARTQNNTATERPSVQLKAYGVSYHAARALLKAAFNALGGVNGLHNITLSGIQYVSIKPRTGFADTGLDATGARVTLVCMVDVEKEPS